MIPSRPKKRVGPMAKSVNMQPNAQPNIAKEREL